MEAGLDMKSIWIRAAAIVDLAVKDPDVVAVVQLVSDALVGDNHASELEQIGSGSQGRCNDRADSCEGSEDRGEAYVFRVFRMVCVG